MMKKRRMPHVVVALAAKRIPKNREFIDKESSVLSFVKSAGGAAAITVVLGGVLGNILSCQIQHSIKERELQDAVVSAYHKQQLKNYDRVLTGQVESSGEAMNLVSKVVDASGDLLESYRIQAYIEIAPDDGKDGQRLDQVEKIRQHYVDATKEWDVASYRLGLALPYYHNNDSEVFASWESARSAVEK